MIKIGDYAIGVDRKQEYAPEEIAKILWDEAADEIGELIMRHNEPGWLCFPVYCIPEERDGMIHMVPDPVSYLYPGHTNGEETIYNVLLAFSENPAVPATEENWQVFGRYRSVLHMYGVTQEKNLSFTCFCFSVGNDEDTDENEVDFINRFAECLRNLGIHNFQGIQQAAAFAKKAWQLANDTDEDPFEVDLDLDGMFPFFYSKENDSDQEYHFGPHPFVPKLTYYDDEGE